MPKQGMALILVFGVATVANNCVEYDWVGPSMTDYTKLGTK